MKAFLVFACYIFGVILCVAQVPIGFKAGVNTNEIRLKQSSDDQDLDGYDSKASFHVGIFTKLKLSNKIELIPEVQFIQKICSSDATVDNNIKLRYIDLPLMISYQPLTWLNIEAGPSFGFNVGDNMAVKLFNDPDIGANGGFRFNLTQKFSMLARYYHGLSPIGKMYFTNMNGVPPAETKGYNQGVQMAVTYYLK